MTTAPAGLCARTRHVCVCLATLLRRDKLDAQKRQCRHGMSPSRQPDFHPLRSPRSNSDTPSSEEKKKKEKISLSLSHFSERLVTTKDEDWLVQTRIL